MTKVYFASDHAGYDMKNIIKNYVSSMGFEIEDCGPFLYDKNDDYPDFIKKAAKKISENPDNFAIIFGGSGQGEAICANRYKNVRAIVFYGCLDSDQNDITNNSLNIIESGRIHNNANILSIGARFAGEDQVKRAVEIFLKTEFSNEKRHLRRINKIDN